MVVSLESLLLLKVIAVMTGVAAVAWLSMALPMRIMPSAGLRFAAGNLCQMVSVLLSSQRGTPPDVLFYSGADIAALLAYALMQSGIQRVVRHPATVLERAVVLGLASTGLLLSHHGVIPFRYHGIIFSLAAAWIYVRTFLECNGALKKEFGLVSLMVVWPIAMAGLLFSLRAVFALRFSAQGNAFTDMRGDDAQPFLWAFLLLSLAINTSLMGIALGRLVGRVRMLSERDALTGAMNRRAIEARVESEIARFRRGGQAFALAVVDLDHFKRINDTLGHKGGDAALVHVSGVLQHSLRETDALGRFGGEEFVVVLSITTPEGALQAAERLRADLAASCFVLDETPHGITASVGVTMVAPGDTADALFRRADSALYRAKELGRNRIEFNPGGASQAMPRLA